MKNELLLIIGPPKSGKTWLADALDHRYSCKRQLVKMWEEPDLDDALVLLNIRDYLRDRGHTIVVCSLVTSEQLQRLAPDRVYSIGLKLSR